MIASDKHGICLRRLTWAWFCLLVGCAVLPAEEAAVKVIDVERVWSGHRVGFSLLTDGNDQFVAYYNAQRQMTVAHRQLGSTKWAYTRLPSHVGWDSHNYVTMALDRTGHLHLSGNMHGNPMIYFRTTRPRDAASLVRVANMVGTRREKRVTYPRFLRNREGSLVFRYRDGGSGNGDDLYNLYDEATRKWRRLVDKPLVSGEGKTNAYCTAPAMGPDGFFHMIWVWRDTPDAATNHDLSYARSRDLVHWETGAGRALSLPITIKTADIADPVPARGGIINGNTALGFDSKKRPVLTYHKYDAAGHTQIYGARLEGGRWKIYQISDWGDYRWNFGGGGSIPFEVNIGGVRSVEGGLALTYRYKRGRGTWLLDEKTLKPTGRKAPQPPNVSIPRSLTKIESDFPNMAKRRAGDLGHSTGSFRYILLWETLGPNRDRAIKGKPPAPSMLRLIRLSKSK